MRMKSTSTARGADLHRTRSGLTKDVPGKPSRPLAHRHSQKSLECSGIKGPRPRSPVHSALLLQSGGSISAGFNGSPLFPDDVLPHSSPDLMLQTNLSSDTGTAYTARWWRNGYAKVDENEAPQETTVESPQSKALSIATDVATVSSAPASRAPLSQTARGSKPPSALNKSSAFSALPPGRHIDEDRTTRRPLVSVVDARSNPWETVGVEPEPHPFSVRPNTNPFSNVAEVSTTDPYADTEPLYGDVVRSPSNKRRDELLDSRHDSYTRSAYGPHTYVAPLYREGSLYRPPPSAQGSIGNLNSAVPEPEPRSSRSERKHFRKRSRPDGSGSGYGRRYRRTSGEAIVSWLQQQQDPGRSVWPPNESEIA